MNGIRGNADVRIGEHFGKLRRVDEGRKLGGRYRLGEELGRGGMAVVWRATDEVLDRPVAVKVLAGRYADDERFRTRILHEARAAATLSHPNIAQIYDFGESGEDGTPVPYVVMELINGPTLQQRVADAPMPPRRVFRICGEVAAALAAAHADGLVHRDIKLANVMVTPTGAKVVDFGIAAAAGPAEPEEGLLGTPAYLAPERLTGGEILPASDVYALGVLLYRLLADESPWTVETTTQMLSAHVYAEPAPLPELPGVPEAVADLVDRCLSKEPADRPDAAEVSAILGDAAEAASVQPTPPPPPAPEVVEEPPHFEAGVARPPATRFEATEQVPAPPPPRPRPRYDNSRLILVGTVLVALLIVVTGWWVTRTDDPAATPVRAAPPATWSISPPIGEKSSGAPPSPTGTHRSRSPAAVASRLPAGPVSPPTGSPAPPVTPEPSAGASAPPGDDDGTEATRLESKGGIVYAICSSGNARIVSWEAADGYEVERVDPGPGLTAAVVFAGEFNQYRMSVTCFGGKPSAVVLPL